MKSHHNLVKIVLILGSIDLKEIELTNHYVQAKFTSAERAKHYH